MGLGGGVKNRTPASNRRPMIHEIRDELLEFFDAVRFFIHMQQSSVPGGLPGVIERLSGKLFLTREVTVDSTLFQASRFHQVIKGAAFITALIEDWCGRLHNLSPGVFAFGHNLTRMPIT